MVPRKFANMTFSIDVQTEQFLWAFVDCWTTLKYYISKCKNLKSINHLYKVIHELLCHPDIDILAVDSDGMTAEKLACAHIKNILAVFK